jgi:hypothetical protein
MPTTSPFAATLDWARTLVAGLTPNTDAAKTFRSVAGDLAIDEEPSVSHRSFSIIADTQPGVTGDIFTTGTRQAKRRFRLAIAYDSLQDSKHNEQAMAEDDDRIIFAIERGPYVSGDVQTINCVDGTLTSHDGFILRTLIFEVLYTHPR